MESVEEALETSLWDLQVALDGNVQPCPPKGRVGWHRAIAMVIRAQNLHKAVHCDWHALRPSGVCLAFDSSVPRSVKRAVCDIA
ncbi:uncharacterized [Tachysurus ichikawai]